MNEVIPVRSCFALIKYFPRRHFPLSYDLSEYLHNLVKHCPTYRFANRTKTCIGRGST